MASYWQNIKWRLKSLLFAKSRFNHPYTLLGLSRNSLSQLYYATKTQPASATVHTSLLGRKIAVFNNFFWFLHSIDEIFVDQVYKCSFKTDTPVILDCGANIGLGIIYFKLQKPQAKIIAFEPDAQLCQKIAYNMQSFQFENVEVVNKAVWKEVTELQFCSEGTLGGQLDSNNSSLTQTSKVPTVRLKDYLNQPIHFLKMDIEGAETAVLEDCKDDLQMVENLFIEYHSEALEPQRLHDILQWVQQAGFRYHIKEAWVNQIFPFYDRKSSGRDMQLNIFCYRF